MSAVKPEWVHDYDAERGQVAARDVVIDFDRKLRAHGVDLIVIPVPSKIEAYAREFETELPAGMPIALGRLEEMLYLLEADVEVVDVLPTLLEAMTEDDEVPVYETTGHHPSGLGVRLLGELVAERLERYDFAERDVLRFSDQERLAGERITPSVPMLAWEVRDRGGPYAHVPDSEIVVIGDSNAFAYGTASWACHIARAAGIPVTDISTSSGAATAHVRLVSQGIEMLKKRKVVIWVISSTHMERLPWVPTDITDEPSFSGLLTVGEIDAALAVYREGQAAGNPPRVDESELNNLGYRLLGENKLEEAVALFEINTEAFPHSANCFDSLGEGYMRQGRRDEAIASFERSLSLNPSDNTRANSLRLLKELGVEYTPPGKEALSTEALRSYVGTYALTDDNRGIVTIEGETLVFEFVGQPKMTLHHLEGALFNTEVGFTAQFTLDDEDRAVAVVLEGRGMRFEGDRTE